MSETISRGILDSPTVRVFDSVIRVEARKKALPHPTAGVDATALDHEDLHRALSDYAKFYAEFGYPSKQVCLVLHADTVSADFLYALANLAEKCQQDASYYVRWVRSAFDPSISSESIAKAVPQVKALEDGIEPVSNRAPVFH